MEDYEEKNKKQSEMNYEFDCMHAMIFISYLHHQGGSYLRTRDLTQRVSDLCLSDCWVVQFPTPVYFVYIYICSFNLSWLKDVCFNISHLISGKF